MKEDTGDYLLDEEGVNLTDAEALSLAFRVIAEWCRHGDHPEWEDLPMLGEHAFERLCRAMVRAGAVAEVWADVADGVNGTDSKALLLAARDEPAPSGSSPQP